MRLRTLRLDRIGRLSAPLIAAALLLGSPSFAPAQTERLPKVGYLGFGASVPPTHFQNRMRELRYSEGKEFTVEYRFAGGRPGELPRLARELVDAKVNVIMAVGDEAIVAAKNATRTVPSVMVACAAGTTGFVEMPTRSSWPSFRAESGSQSCIRSAKGSTRVVSSPTVPTFRRWS